MLGRLTRSSRRCAPESVGLAFSTISVPLDFILATAARRISYADALAFEQVHEALYREHGFELVEARANARVRITTVEAPRRRRAVQDLRS
jgi:predicted ATPase